MSESVPLCPTLSIQLVFLVVSNVLGQSFDLVFEAFPSESWNFWVIEW